MSVTTCQGWVEEKGGRRPCRNTGQAVLSNGYCRVHQYIAVSKIIEKLREIETELKRLESSTNVAVNSTKIKLLREQMGLLHEELYVTKQICSEDQACSLHLRDVLASIRDISEPLSGTSGILPSQLSSHPITKLQKLGKDINRLSVGTSSEDAKAFDISQEHELARRRNIDNAADITQIQTNLYEKSAAAQKQEREFQQGLETLNQKLKNHENQQIQNQQIKDSLEKRIDKNQAESRQVMSVYTQTINRLQEEIKQYKDLYNDKVATEIRLGKTVAEATKNQQALQKHIEELKQTYEQRLLQARNEFAEKSKNGETILSEREENLKSEVERLKVDLETAVSDLKLATEAGKEAITRAMSTHMPYSQVAQELANVNEMLRAKNTELGKLQALHDKKTAEFAQAELKTSRKIDQATAQDRAEIQRLNLELANSEKKLVGIQQEVVSLQSSAYELRRQHQNEIQHINNQLRDTRNLLSQVQTQRESEKNNLQQQYRLMKNKQEADTLEHDFKFNQLKDTLNTQYLNKVAQLQDKYEANQLQIDQEKRNLVLAQKQIQETVKIMNKQKDDLQRYRTAYDEKLNAFMKQKNDLDLALRQAQEQAQQFSQIELDYKKRIDVLRQTVAVQRQRYEAHITQLNTKLKQAIDNRNIIINSLEKCSAARDSIVTKVDVLSDENTRLKDMYLQLKSQMDVARSQYTAHIEKLRSQNSQMQRDINTCAQRLQDGTLVHDHVKRLKDQAQQLRVYIEGKEKQARGVEQALKRLLKDRELEKQQVFRLQGALKDCAIQRERIDSNLKNTNMQLRDIKHMHGELSHEIANISQEYKGALEQREANLAREALAQQVREENLQKELAQTRQRTQQQNQKINNLEKQKMIFSEALNTTEDERHKQLQLLLAAQRLNNENKELVTGRSQLT